MTYLLYIIYLLYNHNNCPWFTTSTSHSVGGRLQNILNKLPAPSSQLPAPSSQLPGPSSKLASNFESPALPSFTHVVKMITSMNPC